MEKFGKVVLLGFKIFSGIAAAYFVRQIVEEKAQELVEDGNALNAVMIYAGEGTLLAAVFTLGFEIAG